MTEQDIQRRAREYAAGAIESHLEDWLNEDGEVPEAQEGDFIHAVREIRRRVELGYVDSDVTNWADFR